MEIEKLIFHEVDSAALAQFSVGDLFKLWSKDDMDIINVYVQRSLAGRGLIATLMRSENPHISRALFDGKDAWLEITSITGSSYILTAQFGEKGDYSKACTAARKRKIPRSQSKNAP